MSAQDAQYAALRPDSAERKPNPPSLSGTSLSPPIASRQTASHAHSTNLARLARKLVCVCTPARGRLTGRTAVDNGGRPGRSCLDPRAGASNSSAQRGEHDFWRALGLCHMQRARHATGRKPGDCAWTRRGGKQHLVGYRELPKS